MKTPKTDKNQSENTKKETTSGKKLKQARLPFQILSTPPVSGAAAATVVASKDKTADKDVNEIKKRKLNYDQEDDVSEQATKKTNAKNANACNLEKKKFPQNQDVQIIDSDGEASVSCSKENIHSTTTSFVPPANFLKQKNFDLELESDMQIDDAEMIETTDEEDEEATVMPVKTPVKTPTAEGKKGPKKRNSKSASKNSKSMEEATVEEPKKVLIKLPTSLKKNKRRKSGVHVVDEIVIDDDLEVDCAVNQPVKRPRLEDNLEVDKKEKSVGKAVEKEHKQLDSTTESSSNGKIILTPKGDKISPKNKNVNTKNPSPQKQKITSKNVVKDPPNENSSVQVELEKSSKNIKAPTEDETTNESGANKSKIHEISSTSTEAESDADAETETTNHHNVSLTDQKPKTRKSIDTTPKVSRESSTTGQKLDKKNLTPKQQKLLEQRLKAREEKERKIQEERLQKQREKEERELSRKREREEKEEQKRKEREEKEEQKRKERDEKERKRLAELEMKNEEKRKRNEAKEEELRKKEEERKRKEQEKEEAELKKKKAAMAFTKFFSRSSAKSDGHKSAEQPQGRLDENTQLAFRPFQIKVDMKLAPTVRKHLTDAALGTLEDILAKNLLMNEDKLYINELKSGVVKPHKWCKPIEDDDDAQKNGKDSKSDDAADDDVVFVEDELERAGQAIIEEPVAPVERLRVKFFKFSENRRPPYYGTWRKKSETITPRRPFAIDKKFFDYEVDSDLEWEEEEPGESLDGSEDEKEKESEDDEYEVDNEWFVPHGHLSDEELQGADGDLADCNDREAQKAKLQVLQKEFAQEMKKKTEKIKPRLIGCIWVDENGNQPDLCPKIIWDTLNTRAILCVETPILEEIESSTNANVNDKNGGETENGGETANSASDVVKLKPIKFTEEMLKQLVKLVHGNTHSKNFIINEFIAFIEANEESVRNGDVKGPLKSAVREKIDECAQWQAIEQQQLQPQQDQQVEHGEKEKTQKKNKNKKKLCWVVSSDKLKELEMENLDLNNNWQYILQPREIKSKIKSNDTTTPTTPTAAASATTTAQAEESNEQSASNIEQPQQQQDSPSTSKAKSKTDIKIYTKVLTAAEKVQQLSKSKELLKTPSTKAKAAPTSSAYNTPSTSALTPTNKIQIPSNAKANTTPNNHSNNNNNNNTTPIVKKRVPLLMSVARGQAISTPDKNACISKFLKTLNESKQKVDDAIAPPTATPTPMDVDEVVVLD